jgi:hypothetical protein
MNRRISTILAMAVVIILAVAWNTSASADQPPPPPPCGPIVVDGVSYGATHQSGPTCHYETPDIIPVSASTNRHNWDGIHGADNLPCVNGIHWIDNANLLTISNCLGSTTPTPVTPTPVPTDVPTATSTDEPQPTPTEEPYCDQYPDDPECEESEPTPTPTDEPSPTPTDDPGCEQDCEPTPEPTPTDEPQPTPEPTPTDRPCPYEEIGELFLLTGPEGQKAWLGSYQRNPNTGLWAIPNTSSQQNCLGWIAVNAEEGRIIYRDCNGNVNYLTYRCEGGAPCYAYVDGE